MTNQELTKVKKTNRDRNREFQSLRMQLQEHHAIFYALWDMAVPIFTDKIPTSAVGFSKKDGGMITFMWNPELWDSLNVYNRAFICSHEALHVMLEHGRRMKGTKTPQLVNQALDVVVNHTLIDFFEFERDLITNQENLCWIDTVFENSKDLAGDPIEKKREFEYYLGKINEIVKDQVEKGLQDGTIGVGSGENQDGHDSLEDILDKDTLDKIAKQLSENLSDEEKKEAGEALQTGNKDPDSKKKSQATSAGTVAGDAFYVIPPEKVKKSHKWVDVIKRWRKKRSPDMPLVETWQTKARRHHCLSPNLFLPDEKEDEEMMLKKSYIDVFFFQDTSGSCLDMKEKFLKCSRSFPEDVFKVRAFCFDTRVFDVDIKKGELFGFGGTAFEPIEARIQHLLKTKEILKYPDAVFLFTDGDSYDHVQPEFPDRWHWFLGGEWQTDRAIPKHSNIHQLQDYI
jgi:hypothetical protein